MSDVPEEPLVEPDPVLLPDQQLSGRHPGFYLFFIGFNYWLLAFLIANSRIRCQRCGKAAGMMMEFLTELRMIGIFSKGEAGFWSTCALTLTLLGVFAPHFSLFF